MLKYSEELAKSGFYVTRYEDRFFWDTPENLAVYPYGTSDGWRKYEKNEVLGGEYGMCLDLQDVVFLAPARVHWLYGK